MRFIENGPAIPNELLNARDEGAVVFFCGAGVSKARAGLRDFKKLTAAVVKTLGTTEDSDAYKALDGSNSDHVFSLLERDFYTADIQADVAKALKPKQDVDLSAHQLLLRLASTPDSKIQLVTTNFDTLFEQACEGLRAYPHPHLPNLARYEDWNGVVYLHGRVQRLGVPLQS